MRVFLTILLGSAMAFGQTPDTTKAQADNPSKTPELTAVPSGATMAEAPDPNRGVIPAGTTYAAKLMFSDGQAAIAGNQKKVDELLALASQRAPWAVQGAKSDTDPSSPSKVATVEEIVAIAMQRKKRWASEKLTGHE